MSQRIATSPNAPNKEPVSVADKPYRYLAVLVAAFTILGVCYSIVTPIFEAPDESLHLAMIRHIVQTRQLPTVTNHGEGAFGQEGLQAPLYYLIGAACTFWIDTSDYARQSVAQPKANFGNASLPGKKNAFLHGQEQAFPYHGTTLVVQLGRWLSVLMGAGTVTLTFFAGRFVFIGQSGKAEATWLALLCAGFLAFIPQFLFINAAISNDPAVTVTSTLALVILLWMARADVSMKCTALLGVTLGLMGLSKMTGTVLAIAALATVLMLSHRLDRVAVALAVMMAIAGWWYARNQIVYGDPLALGTFLQVTDSTFDLKALPPLQFVWDEFRLARFTTWGLFGQMSILMQPPFVYSVLDGLTLVGALGCLAGLAAALIRPIRRERLAGIKSFIKTNQALLICLMWFGVVMAAGLRWLLSQGLQGRLIFPGLPPAIILLVYGIHFLLRRLPAQALAVIMVAPMFLLSVSVIPSTLWPAYSPPPVVKSVPPQVTQAQATFGNQVKMRGYTISRQGKLFRFTFYWETLETPPVDYTVAIRFVRADGSFWLDYVNYPGMGTSLPTTWKPGELLQDDYVFDLDQLDPVNEPLRWIVGYFDPRTKDMTRVGDWQDVREPGWATLRTVDLNQLGDK